MRVAYDCDSVGQVRSIATSADRSEAVARFPSLIIKSNQISNLNTLNETRYNSLVLIVEPFKRLSKETVET